MSAQNTWTTYLLPTRLGRSAMRAASLLTLFLFSACAPHTVSVSAKDDSALRAGHLTGDILHGLSRQIYKGSHKCQETLGTLTFRFDPNDFEARGAERMLIASTLRLLISTSNCFLMTRDDLFFSRSNSQPPQAVTEKTDGMRPKVDRKISPDYLLAITIHNLPLPSKTLVSIGMVDIRSQVQLVQAVGYPRQDAVESIFPQKSPIELTSEEALITAVYDAYAQTIDQLNEFRNQSKSR